MISAEADIHTYPGPEGNPYAPIEAPLPEDMLKSMSEGDRARFSNDVSIDIPQRTPLWIQMSPGELPPAVDSRASIEQGLLDPDFFRNASVQEQSSGNPKMESYLADVRQLYTIPNLRAEAFQAQHDVLMRLYPSLFSPRPEVSADAPIPVESEQEVGQASIFGPAILGLLGGKGRVKTASLIMGVSLLAAQCAPPGPVSVEPSVPPPGATIQVAETATPHLIPTETVVPPIPTEEVVSGQSGVEAFSVVPGLPAGFGGEGELVPSVNTAIIQDALNTQGYAPIVGPEGVLGYEIKQDGVTIGVLNHPDQLYNPDVPEGRDIELRSESGVLVFGGPGTDGIVATNDDIERVKMLTAVSLTEYPDSTTSIAAVVNDPDNPNWGAVEVLLIDETSGEIQGTMPAVFAGTDAVTVSWDSNGLATKVNGETVTFSLTHPLPTETPAPTEVVIKTIQEQLDAWTTEDISNESTVETASGTYTFKVAVSSEVAKLGGLKKFVVDDNTQNSAMLYALARLWHWEDLLGQSGKSPDNTFRQFPSRDLADQPQEFIQAMRSIDTRPTTDILNHQTTYVIEGSLPRQEISGIHIMVVTEEELTQLKNRLQQENTQFIKANPSMPDVAVNEREYITFISNNVLCIVSYNHTQDATDYEGVKGVGLESSQPDLKQYASIITSDQHNYLRFVLNLFSVPFRPFEQWDDGHNRSWVGQESAFGIKDAKEPYTFPASTLQLQVEFESN